MKKPLPRWSKPLSVFFASALFAASLLFSLPSHASSDFPAALRDAAGIECTPSCLSCHTTEPGTTGTATQPFAEEMKDAGLEGQDASTVAPAYELVYAAQQDPNLPPEEVLDLDFPCAPEVLYGCGAEVVPQAPRRSWGWWLVLGALALAFAGRRVLSSRDI